MEPTLTEKLKMKAEELGYLDCGITDVSPFEKFSERLEERMRAFPETDVLYQGLVSRIDPLNWYSEARSLLVCIWQYGQYEIPDKVDRYIGKNYLFDGRKKYSHNYQARKQLEEYMDELGFEYRKGGVPDRWAAVRAGVGNFGRNNFIYTEAGSWVNVETWLLDEELDFVHEENELPCPDDCRQCIDVCPTGALTGPFSMNGRCCIPYLTYDEPGLTPADYREDMGVWLYGCDQCQSVCPLNEGQWQQKREYPYLNEIASRINPSSIFNMDEEFFENEIKPRYFYIDDIIRWKMNAVRAMANTGNNKYIPLLKAARESDDERLRQMAAWGLKKFY